MRISVIYLLLCAILTGCKSQENQAEELTLLALEPVSNSAQIPRNFVQCEDRLLRLDDLTLKTSIDGREWKVVDEVPEHLNSAWCTPQGIIGISEDEIRRIEKGVTVSIKIPEFPASASLQRLFFSDGGGWLAIGTEGNVAKSDDGVTWSHHSLPESIRAIDAAYGNGTWILISSDAIFASNDKITWSRIQPLVNQASRRGMRSIAFGGSKWVIVGARGRILASSDQGKNWKAKQIAEDRTLYAVKSRAGSWLVTGDNGFAAVSQDAENWKQLPLDANGKLRAIYSSPNALFLSGSRDFIKLINGKAEVIASQPDLSKIGFGGGAFVGVGRNGVIGRSEDGKNWKYIWRRERTDIENLWHANGIWFAAGKGLFIFSKDSQIWSEQKIPDDVEIISLGIDGENMLGIADEDSAIWSERDGEWRRMNSTAKSRGKLNKIIFAAGSWFAIGQNGRITTSVDGKVWAEMAGNHADDLLDLATDGKKLVAVGSKNVYSVFEDGKWLSGHIGQVDEGTALNAVHYEGGTWTAVGSDGRIYVSIDGLTWQVTMKVDYELTQVLHKNGRWIVAGGGQILWSKNTIDWWRIKDEDGLGGDSRVFSDSNSKLFATIDGDLQNIVQKNSVPTIKEARLSMFFNSFDVEVIGNLEACNSLYGLVRAQSAHSYGIEGINVRALAADRPLMAPKTNNSKINIPIDIAKRLGLRTGDEIMYSVAIACEGISNGFENSMVMSHPISTPFQRDVYLKEILDPPRWVLGAAALVALMLMSLLVYGVAPLALLGVRRAFSGFGAWTDLKVPLLGISVAQALQVVDGGLLRFLTERPRVLDAWVQKHWRRWENSGYGNLPAVSRSAGYFPLPCNIAAGQISEADIEPTPELIERLFAEAPLVQIVGPGGAGKTMLAVRIGRWCMTLDTAPQGIRRLPVVIDENVVNVVELLSVVRRKIKATLGSDLDDRFLKALLSSGRIVPIFDRWSEQDDKSFRFLELICGGISIGNAVVTTRRALSFEGQSIATVVPIPLRTATLVAFMTVLLANKSSAAKNSSVADQAAITAGLTEMITVQGNELPLTPLLVTLFVEQALTLFKKRQSLIDLPKSVPEAYFAYLLRVNPPVDGTPLTMENDKMLLVARNLAVACLGATYCPGEVALSGAQSLLAAMGTADPASAIKRLLLNGVILQRETYGRSMIRFTLDPVAEYLAAAEFYFRLEGNTEDMNRLTDSVKRTGIQARGFLIALEITYASLAPHLSR